MEFEKNPNPTKDQHFMVDKNMLELIYDTANIQEGESIVEIGGGSGALTDYLVQGKNFVTVIEKDSYYAALLRDKYQDMPNVSVVEGDALNYDFSSYDRLVANLPYTITEPFLINLASSGALAYDSKHQTGSNLKSVTLVLSQNSTRKMVAPVQITEGNSKHLNQEFGMMGAICKAFSDVDIVTAIPSDAFYPEPAVTSFVVNLTPKKKKTTVDRIMQEMLIDKKGTKPSIKRIYQLMLTRGEIYKTSKHKNNNVSMSSSFTSKVIEDKSVYDLTHSQVSQLVQDLIRNDINIKSKNNNNYRRTKTDDYRQYFVGGKFTYNPDDYLDDEDDYSIEETLSSKTKFERNYDYMYDATAYNVLLHRGLENIPGEELQERLGKSQNAKSSSYAKVRK